jgi:IS5 family transposase
VPLAVQVAAANTHDVRTALPLVIDRPAVAGKPGRPQRNPATLVADKGYDSGPLRSILRWLGIPPRIPKRGQRERGLGRHRWVVERTLSWFHQFRRLRIRWDRKLTTHQAFLDLAAAVICYRLRAGVT